MPRLLLSMSETAAALGLCERTVWTLVHEQGLPHVKVGRRILFSRATLEAWIARQEAATQGGAPGGERV
jgi:excisionase family DNA binding protein